jgi:hypothetical protein
MKKYLTLLCILTLYISLKCSEINYIKLLNKTHFSCDDEKNILNINKFNDDYCDCLDGSDENSNS